MLSNTTRRASQRVGSWLISQRTFATQQNHIVKLDHDKFPSDSSSQSNAPIVICHGLFGSKQNWKSLARAFSKRLSTDVYTLVSAILIFVFQIYFAVYPWVIHESDL